MDERKLALFIDDDEDFLEALAEVVVHPKFKIQTYVARNGYRAIDEVIKLKPDVLFVDFKLPRAGGAQILPVLKSVGTFSDRPIYFVTGHSKEEIMPLLVNVEYSGVLQKTEHLVEEINDVLDRLAE